MPKRIEDYGKFNQQMREFIKIGAKEKRERYFELLKIHTEMHEALIQARGSLIVDHMVDDEGNPYGTTKEALRAINKVLSKIEGR